MVEDHVRTGTGLAEGAVDDDVLVIAGQLGVSSIVRLWPKSHRIGFAATQRKIESYPYFISLHGLRQLLS